MKKAKILINTSKLYKQVLEKPEPVECDVIKENKSTAVVYIPMMGITLTVKKKKLIYD